MNFVHFPKLNEYALEPELVKEPSEYGQDKAPVTSLGVVLPSIVKKRRHKGSRQPIHDKFASEYACPAADMKQIAQAKYDTSSEISTGSQRIDITRAGREHSSTSTENCDDFQAANTFLSPRSQFFRRYDHLLLPQEGLDLSRPVGEGDGDTASIRKEYMITSKLSKGKLTSNTNKLDAEKKCSDTNQYPSHTDRLTDRLTEQDTASTEEKENVHIHEKRKTSSETTIQEIAIILPNVRLQHAVFNAGISGKSKYLHTFKRVAVAVVNILKLAKAIIKRTDSPSALLKTFTNMSREPAAEDHSENMKNYGLHFDSSYFRANREISISSEVKSILRLPPSHRTSEQIQTAMFGLQSLPSFAEYPLHMQEKLAKVAWYEIVTPMRTIIRQGHFAENFYFILAGQAVVTIGRPGETGTQTAAIMRKGTSFGELALLHHSKRTATVTSHDTVQLLSVGREDFFDIFMSGHGKDLIPEHIKFISQLEFMKDWPLQRLLERPDQCLLHFFKRNMVIVKNSLTSDWLYVVKSGSCQVLKQLKAVTGNLGQSRRQSLTARAKSNRHQAKAWYQVELMNGRKERTRIPTRPQSDRGEQTPQKEEYSKTEQQGDGSDGLPNTPSPDMAVRSFSKSDYSRKPNIGKAHFGGGLKAPGYLPQVKRTPGLQEEHNNDQQQLQQVQRPQLPVFVQIELLKPKDVFGLDLMNFNSSLDNNPPSVSLVSLGAECIMLSKSFFMKYANDNTKKRFSEIIQPYPDENTLQDSLQTKVNWELYKHSLIAKIMSQKNGALRQVTTSR